MSKLTRQKFFEERKNALLFAKNFIKNPLRNASITPSSASAGRAMVRNIDFTNVRTVVELGPGTGVFTKELVKRCTPGTKIILVELEKSYIDNLKKLFGDKVVVENTDAHLLEEILKNHGVSKLDLIISGLPFFDEVVNEQFIGTIKRHTDTGTVFRFFTYVPPVAKRVYKKLSIKKIDFVLKNIPPIWIYGVN